MNSKERNLVDLERNSKERNLDDLERNLTSDCWL